MLSKAINIAHDYLLISKVSLQDVFNCGKDLFETPIPYSTVDLAASIALKLFSETDRIKSLSDSQLFARMKMMGWIEKKEINMPLAKYFEDKLYTLYK